MSNSVTPPARAPHNIHTTIHRDRILSICLALFGLTAAPAHVNAWEWQNALPQGNTLRDVQFLDSSTGFAVGDGETILHTTDGGVQWQLLHSGSTERHFTRLQMLDAQTGWILDTPSDPTNPPMDYRVNATMDGWSSSAPVFQSSQPIYATYWLDASEGWVGTDGGLYHTTNGGQNWGVILSGRPVQSVFFLDSADGWSGSVGKVFRTSDGGQTWDSTTVNITIDARIDEIQFITPQDGWVIQYEDGPNYLAGKVFASDDGGTTWSEQLSVGAAFGPYDYFTDIEMVDGQTGFACSSASLVFATADAGTTWTEIDSPYGMRALSFVDAMTGWTVGSYGMIRHTTDGGSNWLEQQAGPMVATWDAAAIQFVDPQNGFVTGQQSLLRTTDGGTSWQKIAPTPPLSYAVIRASYFLDAQRGWMVWTDGTLQYTDDGGQTATTAADSLGGCFDMLFWDDNLGWIAGQRFYRTTDGGQNWVEYSFPSPPGEIYSICFIDPLEGWMGGGGGTILHTIDGGQSWSPQEIGQNIYVRTVMFLDDQVGLAVGEYNENGFIFRTADGGSTWDNVLTAPNVTLTGGVAPLDNYVYVVGKGFWPKNASHFYSSLDAGATWEAQTDVLLADGIFGVAAVDPWRAWILGPGGAVVYGPRGTGPTGVVTAPSPFTLFQNYPNPFNPITTIAYELESSATVELAIYNVLGERVRHWDPIVEGPGPHEIMWNGRDDRGHPVASGLYFYRMRSGGVVQARKMLLLK